MLGIVARIDRSGLANVTDELITRLQPERILAVAMGDLARGAEDRARYPDAVIVDYERPQADLFADFVRGCTRVLTVETWYWRTLREMTEAAGARSMIWVMPELWDAYEYCCNAQETYAPWHQDSTRPLPLPVLRWWAPADLIQARSRGQDGIITFVHPTATAMMDRNGTDLVIAALEHVKVPCRLVLQGTGPAMNVGQVRVIRTGAQVSMAEDWRTFYGLGDVLLLPRRYGCLSLPMFEAAAAGMPMILSGLSPQTEIFKAAAVKWIPPTRRRAVPMKGGIYNVWDMDPLAVAECMDSVAAHPAVVANAGRLIRRWAEDAAWPAARDEWRYALT